MWSSLRGKLFSATIAHQWRNAASSSVLTPRLSFCSGIPPIETEMMKIEPSKELLSLAEVEKVLKDIGADDVKVFPAPKRCEFTDYMVVATGRSPWHVRNISQALIYKVKQKQRGANRMLLPTVVGLEGGKWIAIDSGTLIVHAVDEKARAYYNFEGLWTAEKSDIEPTQDLEKAFVKVRRKNNSKKPQMKTECKKLNGPSVNFV